VIGETGKRSGLQGLRQGGGAGDGFGGWSVVQGGMIKQRVRGRPFSLTMQGGKGYSIRGNIGKPLIPDWERSARRKDLSFVGPVRRIFLMQVIEGGKNGQGD